jgi:predicted dehydrogenase
MKTNRRNFLKKLSGTTAALTLGSTTFATTEHRILKPDIKVTSNDKIRIGLIGAGIIGHYDTDTALEIKGVELAAVCDLYTGRLEYAKEKWGKDIFTTRDYREILNRKDIDAVLVCTPDHWHDRISIDALNAGKSVYCEKPMIQKVEYGHAVIEAQKKSGKAYQVGSQRASSVAILEAKKQLASGIIGELTYVEATNDRNSASGAWQYSIPTDASPQTVDFDTFLGRAPKVPFDATRFFRWRNYQDYGTGVAGDLFVHLLTGLHVITGSMGPNRIFASGDLNYWKDGRDAYDLVTAIMDYPKSEAHASFQFFCRVNLADGAGGGSTTKLIGTEGVIEMGWNDFKIKPLKRPVAPGFGGYDSFTSFSAKQKEEFKKWYEAKYSSASTEDVKGKEIVFKAPDKYDDKFDHMTIFFEAARTGKQCNEDAVFGLRAAGPAVLCNTSVLEKKVINWDPVDMKVIK